MTLRLFAALALFACADQQDRDGDGAAAAVDCDDADAAVHPGADEACDGVDSDCDALADDDDPDAPRSTFYADLDGDSFGRATSPTDACAPPEGFVEDATDCDDARAQVYPGAPEGCDGLDGDCDGLGDDAEEGATTWYFDADGDGFGDPTVATQDCAPPPAHVADATDCDDADADAHPGAEDACGGGDADCDGVDDACAREGDVAADSADAAINGVSPGDAAGTSVAAADFDGDGVGDLVVAAPGGAGTAGQAVLLSGPFAGPSSLHDATATVYGPWSDAPISRVAAGDLDGDGRPELVAGAPDGAGVWVFGPDLAGEVVTAGAARAFSGEAGDGAGASLLAGFDLDGDGRGDLAAGAPDGDAGGVWVWTGAGDAAARVVGDTSGGAFGAAVAAGDFDGDGADDLAIGAPGAGAGAVYVVLGPLAGAVSAADADAIVPGDTDGDAAGAAVAAVGDVNGDGRPDLMVGAPEESALSLGAGAAYLLLGGAAWPDTLGGATCRLTGLTRGDGAGTHLTAAGDLDGDERADVLVSTADAGYAPLLLGPFAGTISLAYAELTLLEQAPGDALGASAAGGVDLDGDGVGDLVVGSPAADPTGSRAGRLDLWRGWVDP